jgi:hypothetical protein
MPTSPHGPTPDQIKKVQTNLTNMQAFNDQVYSFGLAKYLNAYALLSEHDDNDLGLAVGLNIIEGAFWAAGSVGGPIGSDAVFPHDLRMRPRMTLEKFLGIKIPEVITLNIVQEFPWSFGFVLPSPISNQLPAVPSAVSGAAASAPNAQQRLDQFFTTSPPAVARASGEHNRRVSGDSLSSGSGRVGLTGPKRQGRRAKRASRKAGCHPAGLCFRLARNHLRESGQLCSPSFSANSP